MFYIIMCFWTRWR